MKKFSWKKIGIAFVSALAMLGVLMVSLAASNYQQQLRCNSLQIHILPNDGSAFLSDQNVRTTLFNYTNDSISGDRVDQVAFRHLEKVVDKNPYVEKSQVYVDALGNVHVNVMPRIPVLRVINSNGVSYYLDAEGNTMPLSDKFTAHVPVAMGNIHLSENEPVSSDSAVYKNLYTMTCAVRRDSFLNSLVDEIWVDDAKQISFFPRVGNQQIIVGDTSEMKQKTKKLKLFYTDALHGDFTLSDYATIDIRFDGEIYCTRINSQPDVAADSFQINPNEKVAAKDSAPKKTNILKHKILKSKKHSHDNNE